MGRVRGFGISNKSMVTVDAENNYWGASNGATPPGSGDRISDFVDADPFVANLADLDAPCGRTLLVVIDIKPGSDDNPINLGSNGVVPVAVLTTSKADGDAQNFDARDIDQATVKLAGASPIVTENSGQRGSFEDVDGDGDLDLLVHLPIPDLDLAEADTEATLEGLTLEGRPILGTDAIVVVP